MDPHGVSRVDCIWEEVRISSQLTGDLRSGLVVVDHQRLEISMSDDSSQLQDVQLFREPPDGLGTAVVEVHFAMARRVSDLSPKCITHGRLELEDWPEAKGKCFQDLAGPPAKRYIPRVAILGFG